MLNTSTFTVSDWQSEDIGTEIQTALPLSRARMVKVFRGEIVGRSETQFTAASSEATGAGSYVALESFEGEISGRAGSFNFLHSGTTLGKGKVHEMLMIVPGSGTAEFAGIAGTGSLLVDSDGTHHLTLEWRID